MTVQLSMLGIVVGDMPTALRFYRLLGLDIPAEADDAAVRDHPSSAAGSN